MTKYVVVVGGVISGVGKGVATASIGRILKEHGFSVTAIKIDPYINCDAGTMRPTEHGEVWVTHDGGETDQDLGNYERFLDENIPMKNSITTGQIYRSLIEKERKGEFLGKTVDFIPHVPQEIMNRIKQASNDHDICLVEIGGTVGEYQHIPFLLAIRDLEKEVGQESLIKILVSYLPTPSHIEEMKTKPTQMSIKLLEESGIHPDMILCRGKEALDDVRKKKIEVYANIKSENVISMPDVTGPGKPNTIYSVPLELEKENLGNKILAKLNLERKKEPDWSNWRQQIYSTLHPKHKIRIAIIGKYLDVGDFTLKDSYVSVLEALRHAGAHNDTQVEIDWINARDLEDDNNSERFSDISGVIVPGGFGASGVEGKIRAIEFCRENNVPFLGLCYGLQLAVVEFARSVCGLPGAHTAEVDPETTHPVIAILPEQENVHEKGGTMRLGNYPAMLKDLSKTAHLYRTLEAHERHRHRYEVNPEYHAQLAQNGLIFSGMSPDGRLVEFIELENHRFFIATQAHPEFQSTFLKPAPLFNGFVAAALSSERNL